MNVHSGLAQLLLGLTICSALVSTSLAQQQCGPEAVTKFGRWFEPGMASITASHPRDSVVAGQQDFKIVAIRVLIGVTAGTSVDWNLVFRDLNYRPLASFAGKDFLDHDGKLKNERWTGQLEGDRVMVELESRGQPDVRIDVFSAVAFPHNSADVKFFSIVNPSSPWKELYEEYAPPDALPDIKRAGDSVGLIMGSDVGAVPNSLQSWCCSGVLVSPDIMLTNWHCGGSQLLNMQDANYWRSSVCQNTLIDLGWAKGAVRRLYSCVKVLASDPNLDFALLRIAPVVGQGEMVGTPIAARFSKKTLVAGEQLFIIHHAKCAEKLVSPKCSVKSASYPSWRAAPAGSEFSHDCNSEPGASGAPVFDNHGDLIGLHHLGQKRSATCEPEDDINKAISLAAIVQFLKDKKPDLARELELDRGGTTCR